MLVNLCYVSRAMGVIKVSNSKNDLQGHSRALAMAPFDRLHTISYASSVATICLDLAPFLRYDHLFPNTQKGHVIMNIFLTGVIHYAYIITFVYQSAHKLQVPSFTNSTDMIGAKLKNRLCDPG